MSNAIDQRIVEMSFENHKFEKGILESKKSLKEFSDVLEKTSTGKDFNGLERSIETVSRSFSALEQIGIGALRRIGEAAINAGANLFKGLAIEPISQGFGEMELKMNSTQTIMASTGETLATVNQYLRDLNEYSDRTIYSFANMTSNIGKFTNAGVKLDTAVASIKGISNAAALAGANSEEASRAMYNFAQALSAGYVKLVDWKSIELANMATVEFKTQLLEAAVAAGTVTKEAGGMYKVLTTDMSGNAMEQTISATKNFNESLSFQWMTTDALTRTLSDYADETTEIGKRASRAATQVTTFTKLMATLKESVGSGWAQTFEIIFGDFNEGRDLWSGMNDVLGSTINRLSDMRNDLLTGGLGSGWKQFMKEGIEDTSMFGETLANVARDTGIDIDKMIKDTGSMEKAIKGNWLTGDMLTKTLEKMSTSIESLSGVELENAGYTEKTKTQLLALRDALLSGTLSADEFAEKMSRMSGRENIIQGLKNSVIALLTALRPISKAFDQIFPPKTAENLYNMTEVFKNFTQNLILGDETVKKIQRTFAGFFAVVDIGWQTVKFLGNALWQVIGVFMPLNGNLLDMTASIGDALVVLNQLIKQSGVFEYALLGVKIAAILIKDVLQDLVGGFLEFIHVLWTTDRPLEYLGETVNKVFADVVKGLQNGIKWISTKFMGALTGIQKLLNTKLKVTDGGPISDILGVITDFLLFLTSGGADGISSLSEALNSIDFNRIATFVTGGVLLLFINQLSHLTKVSADLVTTTNSFMGKFSKKLFGNVTKFKDLAFAVGVLSLSLYVLSRIPWEDLKKGLIGLAGAMLIFVGAYAAIQAITVIGSKKLNGLEAMKSSLNLTALAGGLAIMAIAIQKISKIDETKVWESVAVVAAMMGIIAAYQALSVAISLIPGTRAANVGMTMMASGLLGLIGIVLLLDNINPETITASLAKLAGAMVMLAGIQALFALAARLSGGNKVAVNVFGIAGGILAMIGVIKLIGLLTPEELAQGVKSVFLMGSVLAAIQFMFSLAARISGGIKLKTNIFAMQMGIVSMIALTAILGTMDPETVQNGIVSLAKMAGVIGVLEIVTALAARLGSGHKLQKILGSVSLTMLSFTALIAVVGQFKDETIDRGFKTLVKMTGLIMAIELMTAVIGSIRGTSRGAGLLIGMTITILTVVSSLALLSMLDQDALASATESLSKVIFSIGVMAAGIGIMMRALSGMSSGFGALRGIVTNLIPGFVVLGAVLLAGLAFMKVVNVSSTMIDGVSWSSLTKFAVGLGLVSVLATAFTLLAKIPGLSTGLQGLKGLIPGFVGMGAIILATAGMFALIGTVLPTIEKISFSALGKLMVGLGLVGALTVGFALLGPLFMVLGTGFLPALGGVLTAIVGAGLIIGAFVGLAALMEKLFASDPDFLMRGIDKLVLIGEGMGRFVGALAGGFNTEMFTGYGKSLAGFVNAISGIDTSSLMGVESLAKAILTLTGASILDGLARFVNSGKNPGEVFGEQIKGLLKAFKGISPEDANDVSNVLRALEPTMKNLATIIDVANNIPNSGGILGDIVGENDIDDFGKKVRGLIKAFSKVTVESALNTATVLRVLGPTMENFTALINAASDIPNSGGLLGEIMGENDIDDFGKQIRGLINAFSKVTVESASKTSGVLNALAPTMTSFTTLVTAASGISNSGGLAGLVMGNNDIDDFGKQIKGLIKAFGNLDQGQVKTAHDNISLMSVSLLPGLEKFITLYNRLNATGGVAQSFTGQSSFTALADEIKSFVKILKGVDISVVAPALESLDRINESFKVIGTTVIMSAIASLKNNKIPFQNEIIKLLNSTVTIVDGKQDIIAKSFVTLLDKALAEAQTYVDDFRTLGYDLVRGLQNGIKSGQNYATYAANTMSGAVISASRNTFEVRSPSKVFAEIGKWLPIGLGNGITRNAKVAILASANMASGVEEATRKSLGIHSESEEGVSIGAWWSKSVGNGVESGKAAVLKTAESLGLDTTKLTVKGITEGMTGKEGAVTKLTDTLLDMLTGKSSMTEVAESLGIKSGDAFTAGITDAAGNIDTKSIAGAYSGMTKDAFQIFKESIDKRKEYNQISAWEEITLWQEFTKKYVEGTEIRMKADKEVARLRFEYSKTWIDKEKYYKRLSLEQELTAWENVQARYAKGTEYRLQAEREIFRLKEEIWQAEYQHALDFVDDEKYYGRMNLSEELGEWKKIASMTKDNSDERKKADREIFRLENEIRDTNISYEDKLKTIEEERTDRRKKAAEEYYSKEKEVTDKLIRDSKSLTDAYESAVDSRTKTLYSTYGLFDKVEKPQYVSGFELINNLEDQNTAFDKWQSSIGTLAAKGVDDGLIKELRDMGPKSLAQINALNRLSDSELSRYVDLWQKKSAEAKDQAVSEFAELKTSNDATITQMTIDTQVLLDGYKTEWTNSLKSIDDDTKTQLNQLETDWTTNIGSMTESGITLIKQFKLDWFGEIANIVSSTKTSMAELKNIAAAPAIKPMAAAVTAAVNTLTRNTNTESAGENIVKGLVRGITATTPAVVKAANTLSNRVITDIDSFWMIQSPSKRTMETGKFIAMGMADGIRKFSNLVSTEGVGLGETALAAMGSSISSIPDLIGDDMGAFTITPVMDLSNVQSGMGDVNSILNGMSGLDLTNTMRLLPKTSQTSQNGMMSEIRSGLLSMTNPQVDLSGKLTVEIRDNKGEIVGMAVQEVKDLLRRESR